MKFGMELERNYVNTLRNGQKQLLLPETPSEESMRFLLHTCFDYMVGASVMVVGRTMNPSKEVEDFFVETVRRKFAALRIVLGQQKLPGAPPPDQL